MPTLTPLRFQPLFRRYVWGGRRLESLLNKRLGDGGDYAESWEIVDHGPDQSVVAAGPWAGRTLADLVRGHGAELLGRHAPLNQFPLLFKFLDANQKLSVQVHPNDAQSARQQPPDLGKTEAWVILHADPGSVIYAGLKRGFDRAAFEREVHRGTTELCLHRFEPRVGDCLFIPAGTVHALGSGLVVAEIQQASDTTFRLFDWNRVGTDGRPRPLHIAQALDVIRYDFGPVTPQIPQPSARAGVEQLIACDKFILDRWKFAGPLEKTLGGDERFHIVVVLSGAMHVAGDPFGHPLCVGETMLLPATAGRTSIIAAEPTTLLDIYLP